MEEIIKIKYHLTSDDFLESQLYSASKSDAIRKRINTNRYLLAAIYLGVGLWSFYHEPTFWIGVLFTVFSVLWYIYYVPYTVKKYKKQVAKMVSEKFEDSLGTPVELTIDDEFVHYEDVSGDGKIEKSEVDTITELKNTLLIQMNGEMTLIIPKRDITDLKSLINRLMNPDAEYLNQIDWVWDDAG